MISVSKPELKAIYEKIGREKGLEIILKDFYQRLSSDVMLGFFFDGKNLPHIIEMQKRFLMKAMGASDSYSGLPPNSAHHKIAPILSGHFDRRHVILTETLKVHGLNDSEIKTWLEFENAFRDRIVKN